MSSDSSPSPDDSDKSKKNRCRKPDIQLYVPRAKRIENEAKQKLHGDKDDATMKFIETSSTTNHNNNNNFHNNNNNNHSRTQNFGWKPKASWFTSSTEEKNEKENDDDEENGEKIVDGRQGTSNLVADEEELIVFEDDDATSSIIRPMTIGRSKNYSNDDAHFFRNKPQRTPPQPNPTKLPQQQVEAMLKMYNITAPSSDDDEGKNFLVPSSFENVPCSSAESESTGAEKVQQSKSFTESLEEDVEKIMDDAKEKTSSTTKNNCLLNKNEADLILDSLPTSYDEFESKDITAKLNHDVYATASATSSTSPLSSVPRTPISFGGLIGVGGFDSAERTSSSSPSVIDPDDLEVQLINESFEEQMKQAQVLSNVKTKEAFYGQPNNLVVDASSLRSTAAAVKPKTTRSTTIHQHQSSSAESAANQVKQGLTWAGWGAGAGSSSASANNELTRDSTTGIVVNQSSQQPPKKSSSGSIGSSTSSLDIATTSASTISLGKSANFYLSSSSSSTAVVADNSCCNDNNMDELSKAMIDKVLSDDDDDVPSKVVVDNAPKSSASAIFPATKNLQSSSTAASESSSRTTSVAESWEDILESNVLPEQFNLAVRQVSLEEMPKIDYLQFKPREKEVFVDDNEFGHVLEAYDFPATIKSETLHLAIQQLACKHFTIEWVDDTHALIICTDKFSANTVLDGTHPVIKLRPLSHASAQSKRKAKESPELLRTFKPRPETNAFLARRLVENHLGKKTAVTVDQRTEERKKIQKAKEQRKFISQLRDDMWEGNI